MSISTNSNYVPLNDINGLYARTTCLENILDNYSTNWIDNEANDLFLELNALTRLHRVTAADYSTLYGRLRVIQTRAHA